MRFFGDLRAAGPWLPVAAAILGIVSAVGLLFALEDASRSPWGQEPSDVAQVVRLGALHTGSGLVHEYRSEAELTASRLDDPGMHLLMSAMAEDPRMRLSVAPGQVNGEADGDVDLVIASATEPDPDAVTAHGGHLFLAGAVRFSPASIDELLQLGVAPSVTPSELVRGFVCEPCSLSEVRELAQRMSDAEASTGTETAYFALPGDGDRTQAQRMRDRAQTLERWHLGLAVFTALLFAGGIVSHVWRRRRDAYRIDLLAGASLLHIWARAHGVLFLGATMPAGLMLLGLQRLTSTDDMANPLSLGRFMITLIPLAVFHCTASGYLAIQARHLQATLAERTR